MDFLPSIVFVRIHGTVHITITWVNLCHDTLRYTITLAGCASCLLSGTLSSPFVPTLSLPKIIFQSTMRKCTSRAQELLYTM